MKIAGLVNLSLVDFPGTLAVTVFTQGCNFQCGYCHNPDLVTCEKSFDFSEEGVFDFLESRRELVEGVVITGGEPTINEDLPGFIQRAKKMGFDVKLDTNGSNPGQLEYLIREKLVDYLAIDIKTSLPKYAHLTSVPDIAQRVTRSICLTMLTTIPYEFRTTCVPGVVDDKDFRLIGETVKGAKKYCLQQFRPLNTYDKNFENITPYKKEDLRRFRNILEGFVEVVEIRGI